MENMDVIMKRVIETDNLTGPSNQFFVIMFIVLFVSLLLYVILMRIHQQGKNAYDREKMIKIDVKVAIAAILFLIFFVATGNKMKKDAIDNRYDVEFQRRYIRQEEEIMGDYLYEYPSVNPDHYGLYYHPDGQYRDYKYNP